MAKTSRILGFQKDEIDIDQDEYQSASNSKFQQIPCFSHILALQSCRNKMWLKHGIRGSLKPEKSIDQDDVARIKMG